MDSILALYPFRPGHHLAEQLEPLLHEPEYEISHKQKAEIIEFEHTLLNAEVPDKDFVHAREYLEQAHLTLGDALPGIEKAWEIKVNEVTFGLKYFLTSEGQEKFQQVFGRALEAKNTFEAATGILKQDYIGSLPSKAVSDLAGDSIEYEEKQIVDAFEADNFESIDNLLPLETLSVTKNPRMLADKANGLRMLKGYYKAVQKDLESLTPDRADNAVVAGKQLFIRLHRERLNQLIAGLYPHAYELLYQYHMYPRPDSEESLRVLETCLPGFSTKRIATIDQSSGLARDEKVARNLQRIDWYQNGIAVERDETGKLIGVGSISSEAKALLTAGIETEPEVQREKFDEYDPAVFKNTLVDSETRLRWARKILEARDVLSTDETYDTDRSSPAADGKWQAVMRKEFKQHSINDRQRVSKLPQNLKDASLQYVLPVMEHENLGHVAQRINQQKLEFGLSKRVGVDDTVYHAEAGALSREHAVREALTGEKTANISGTSYLAAARERLAGKDYRDSMKAYYEDYRRRNPELLPRKAAEIATNRARRIYGSGGRFVGDTSYLTNSKPFSYLEGEFIVRQLPENLRHLLMVGGINLGKLALLHSHGLVDINAFYESQNSVLDILEDDIRQELAK